MQKTTGGKRIKRTNTRWQIFLTFFKIGAFTFGGGYAVIPLIQAEAAQKQGWVSDEDILEIVAIAESTPGPIAINAATFVGYRACGVLGSVCATLGVVLPGVIVILIVAKCYDRFRQRKLVQGAMSGLKPAVIGMIATAVLSVGKTVFVSPGLLVSAAIFAAMAVLAFKKVHPIIIICISAALGVFAGVFGI